jgi:hypothetical protein
MSCSRAGDLQSHSPTEVLFDTVVATLITILVSVYVGLVRWFGCLQNLLQEMYEYVRHRSLLETAYALAPHPSQRCPKFTTRTPRFLDGKYGSGDKSKYRLDGKQSSQ